MDRNERITITHRQTFAIDDAEHLRLTISGLLKFNGLTEDHFIKDDGVLYEREECGGGSHSWYDDKQVRHATPADRALFAQLQHLRECAAQPQRVPCPA
jgi:hypothetical protein